MAQQKKILPDLKALAAQANALRDAGKKLVLCHGTFDLLHPGHIRHLEAARKEGDALVVTLTEDSFVSKGPGRPVFNNGLRAESLAALSCVDLVAVVHHVTAMPAIEAVKPHVYAKGSDYRVASDDLTGNITKEQQAVENHGGRMVFTDDLTFSSSKLINQHLSVFSDDVKAYLSRFGSEHDSNALIDALKELASLKVCVVGDAIVDEYHYTDPMGQTGKGNILAAMHRGVEQFAGGSLAVANHIAGFCGQVSLLTGLGAKDSHEAFIRQKLADNVTPHFFYRPDAPTVRKSRFVDQDTNKLFEVYYYEPSQPPREFDEAVCAWIDNHLGEYDVVIVPDFGNGFISDNMVSRLVERSRFMGLNTQINSGNRGFHTVNRYERANFVSLNEPELRLAVHSPTAPLEDVAREVANKVGAQYLAVTLGTRGLWMLDVQKDHFERVPALSIKVIDRIGAGDAFLSLSGICLGAGLGVPIASFVGAVAAALDVQIVCNRSPVDPVQLFKYITTLLK